MTRCNTCPGCGHYVQTHHFDGCQCMTWDPAAKKMTPCECKMTRVELVDLEHGRFEEMDKR